MESKVLLEQQEWIDPDRKTFVWNSQLVTWLGSPLSPCCVDIVIHLRYLPFRLNGKKGTDQWINSVFISFGDLDRMSWIVRSVVSNTTICLLVHTQCVNIWMWLADPAAKLRVVLQKNQGETSWESQTLRYVVFSGAFDKMINM